MMPPVTSSAKASRLRSSHSARIGGGIDCSQIRSRSAAAGPREVDVEAQPSREGGIDVLGMIGGQDREARELLHALEQVGDLDVGVAVVRVADGAALAEQRVGLVEEQHGAGALGVVEDDVEVLLGLADVFRDDLREVDGIEIGRELGGDGMGGHRLAGAALAGEQGGDALRVDERAEAPIVEHLAAEADMLDQRAQLGSAAVAEG